MSQCKHFGEAAAQVAALGRPAKAHARGCEDCVPLGDTWVHLRQCLECGHVGCCDSSKNRHATAHFHGSRHPVMRSVEPGETWGWCYVDGVMPEDVAAL